MACSGCSTGRGSGTPAGCNNNGSCGIGGCNKLNIFDWLANMHLPQGQAQFNIVEVRFKNNRKEFFINKAETDLFQGDVVAVEAQSGHDIGAVSMAGELVKMQLKKLGIEPDKGEFKTVYRKAKQADIEKWHGCINREVDTMYKARVIASGLGLDMKLSDVEFQGDGSKATFYYTAPDRVDFRELIKRLADEFKIRIEMRQIGPRQEAARLGGIGSCGRELCCSTWLRDFRTVNTSAARYQQLALNPQKLAGQCGKLKCCLNYELDSYLDALKDFPETDKPIVTKVGIAYHMKTDIFKRLMWYAYRENPGVFIAVTVDRVKDLYAMMAQGLTPDDINLPGLEPGKEPVQKQPDYENVVGQDSLTRFDRSKYKNKNNKNKKRKPEQGNNQPVLQGDNAVPPNNNNRNNNNPNRNNNNPNNRGNDTNRPPRNNNNNNRNNNNRNNRPPRNNDNNPNNRPPQPPPQES